MNPIKQARYVKGISSTELAELAGIERAQLSRIENGKVKNPRPGTLKKICEALGIPVIDLLR